MISEANFNDIKRNYILSSVFLILFLIYGGRIEIHRILLFDLTGEWYIFSKQWDIFLMLFLFFLYTFIRYVIYGIDNIKKNNYSHLLLYEILNNIIKNGGDNFTKNKYFKEGNFIDVQDKSLKLGGIDIFENDIKKKQLNISGYIGDGPSSMGFTYSIVEFNNIHNIVILKDRIKFDYDEAMNSKIKEVDIRFNSNDIKKEFGINIFKIILQKNYSDFIWPLLLVMIIYLILCYKIVYFLYSQ